MGKVAVITGGSTGIGLAMARLMVEDHFSVALIARDENRLNEARVELEQIAPSDVRILTLPADVAIEEQVAKAMNAVLDRWGKIDWLVTSAGYSSPGYFEEQTTAVFRKTMEINFFGTLHSIRHALPVMKQRKIGNIVMISSGAGLVGIFGSSSYSSSKFALTGLAEVLRSECKAFHIQVSVAYPPDTDTAMMERTRDKKPWEAKLLMSQGGFFSAEKVAKSIYRGARRGRFAITTGSQLFIVNRFKSLIYPYIFRTFDKKLKKGREKRKKEQSS